MNLKIINSNDGSKTLLNERLGETYHSIHGAIQEANHVFIKMGLSHIANLKDNIKILEFGFGTGLNMLVTLHQKGDNTIIYHSYETEVINAEIIKGLNYTENEPYSNHAELFTKAHEVNWNTEHALLPDFKLKKIHEDLLSADVKTSYDLIYFDAFAPNYVPDQWEVRVFKKMYNIMNTGAILVTYCAKGQVRRNMVEAGLEVERLPGPPGKREMLRATKS